MNKENQNNEYERARKALLSLLEDQKLATEKLKESEELFRTLAESTSTAIFIYKNEKFVYVNKATEILTGYSNYELLTMNFWDTVHPDYKEIIKQRGLARQRGEQIPTRYEFKLIRKTGEEVWVDFSAGKIIWKGEPAAIGSAFDITERKKAEERLKKSEERYSLVIDAIDQGLWDWDVTNNEVYLSPQWKKQIGYEDNEIENNFQSWVDHLHPDDKERCSSYVNNYLKNPTGLFEIEFRFRHKNGSYKYIYSKASKILDKNGKIIRLFGAHSDITQQKIAELEKIEIQKQRELQQKIIIEVATSEFLRKGEVSNLFKLITEKVAENFSIERVSAWLFDDSQKNLICQDQYELSKNLHTFGYILNEDEFTNEINYLKNYKYLDANDPLTDIRTKGYEKNYLIPNNITSMLDAVINYNGKNIGTLCFEHVNKKHVWNTEEINFACQLADQIAICLSNNERREAQEKLKESEEKYRLIAENTADSIAVFDLNLNYTYLSPSTKKFLGYEIDELKSLGVQKILKEGYLELFRKKFFEELQKEKSGNVDLNRSETVISEQIKKDGTIIWVEANVSFIRNEKSEPIAILTVNRDVTERINLTNQIKSNEEKLRLLVEGTPNFFFYTQNTEGYITYISPTVEKITGYKTEEWFKQKNWFSTENPINKKATELTYKHLSGEITHDPIYFELYHKNGNKVLLEIYENPIIKDGAVIGLQGIATDITEKKRAEIIQNIQYNIANAVVTSKSLNELFDVVRHELSALISTKNFFIAFYDEEKDSLHSNIDKDEKDEIPVWSAKKSLTGYVIKKRIPVLLSKEDIIELANKGKIELIGTIPESWVAVPLIISKKVIGVLAIQDYYNKNAYDKHSLEVLEIISKQLSVYIEHKRAEEKLLKLSIAVEQSPISIVITDTDGNIEYVNPKFCEVSGYCFSEAIGQNSRILKSGKTDPKIYEELWSTITNGTDWSGEFINKKKNGEIYFESTIISPLKNQDGVITNFVAVKEDITEKKKLLDTVYKSEEQLRSIWENSIDAMRLIDDEGIIINVNDAFCKLFEMKKEELIGKPFDVCYGDDKGMVISTYKERNKGNTIPKKLEAEIKLHNHKKIWIDVSNSHIEIKNNPPMLLSIIRDISDKKKIIEELIAAKEKAEEMNRVKTHFFATMSHELRTPFVGIMGFAEMLYDEIENQEHKDMAARIIQASKRLTNTLNQILDMTKLEFDKQELNITNFDIIQVIDDVYLQFEKSAKIKKLELRKKSKLDSLFINSDEKLVSEILINLVNNAIKYTDNGWIEIYSDKKIKNQKEYLVIEVRDTGIGISQEKQFLIWEEFRQASEGTSRQFEGTGLGLSIAKRFSNIINANLYLKESQPNVGSTFVLEVPVEAKINIDKEYKIVDDTIEEKEFQPDNITFKKKKILYVEDDQMAVDIVKKSLSKNYDVDCVTNSTDTLNKIKDTNINYDLILMDINLGRDKLDGLQLTEKIRKIDRYKTIPFVALTAYAREEDKNEFLSKGLDYYLSKPFTISDLRKLISDILNE